MTALSTCLGFKALGICAYNPANPALAYFSVGDAIAALAFTLAVQQFLKPVFVFRLEARGIKLRYLYVLVFAGASFAAFGALVPNLPFDRALIFAYPIAWELLGATFFATAYGLLAFGSTIPLKLKKNNTVRFVRAAAQFITENDGRDYVDIGRELLRNLSEMTVLARFTESASSRSSFFHFTNRKKLEAGGYAASMLRIMSDERFCRSLIEGCPWRVAVALTDLSEKRLHSRSGERFIQGISSQAIQSDLSIFAREVGYSGFRHAPVLSDALFKNYFIVRNFRPLDWLTLSKPSLTKEYLSRLGNASESIYSATLEAEDYWDVHHLHDVTENYERVFSGLARLSRQDPDYEAIFAATHPIEKIIECVREHLAKMDRGRRDMLYVEDDYTEESRYPLDLIDVTAELVIKTHFAFANEFDGHSDPFWSFAIGVWMSLFPSYDSTPPGMDPLQQRVALLLRQKIRENMKGWYPAITRVMLAVNGPYNLEKRKTRTAARTFMAILYREMKGFRLLPERHANHIEDYLPKTTSFDRLTNTLTHMYSDGQTRETNLSRIRPPAVNLGKQSVAN